MIFGMEVSMNFYFFVLFIVDFFYFFLVIWDFDFRGRICEICNNIIKCFFVVKFMICKI